MGALSNWLARLTVNQVLRTCRFDSCRPHAVNIGQYRIAAIAGDCKSLPSGSWVRVPVLALISLISRKLHSDIKDLNGQRAGKVL